MWIHVRIYLELTRRLLQSALAEHDPAGAGGAPGLGRTSSANGKSTGVLCSFSGGVHRSRPTAHPRPPRPRSRRRCQSSAARGLDAADRHPEVVTADGLEFVSHGHTENASTRCGPRRAGLPKEKATIAGGFKNAGGVDGSRTRDPRRDRQSSIAPRARVPSSVGRAPELLTRAKVALSPSRRNRCDIGPR